jgi:lysophospholipase L1-like esterase
MSRLFSNLSSIVCAAAAVCAVMIMPAETAAQTLACTSPSDLGRLDHPLRRVAQRIAAHQPLTIVAIGSSSTAGAGATSSAASYPSRLEIELRERFHNLAIRVLNRGVGGEEMADMLARFDKAVVAEQPDLVLWQLGTNSVLRDRSLSGTEALIHQGVARIKAVGADVVLIDPQFAPRVIVKADAERMVDLISAAAKMDNVSVFHRFVLMRYWSKVRQIPFDTFVSPDGLHMNDWSYACVAKVLAAAIHDAATRATTVAGAPTSSR